VVTHPTGSNDDPDQRRLDDLGRRIDAVREQQPQATPAQPPGRLNIVYRLSTEFVAAVFVGLALGWGFDAVTGLKPVGIIGFSVLGIAAAFYMVFRAMRELNAEQNERGK
jgi:ATP synthase protein I